MEFLTVSKEDLEQIADALNRFSDMPDEIDDINEVNEVVRELNEAATLINVILGDHR